jgi:RHS repeat-associated protein
VRPHVIINCAFLTQKERDSETGRDYFGARYYSNALGRFMSVDPIKLTATRLRDPQRINLYGYCRNNPLKYIDPDGEDVIPANAQSAAQLRSDLDKNLKANEAANIKVTAGQNITIINPNAIDLSKASPAYKYLLDVIKPGKTYNYNAVSQGDTIKTSDGRALSWDDVRGGATIPIDTNSLKTATVIDIFVPTTDAPDVLGQNGGFVSFPRDLVSLHELEGHGRCGPGQCAVDVENELRDARNPQLPRRSGADHESLPGERPGNQGSTQQNVNVPGSPELLKTNPTPINTGPLPMRPIQPLPPPPKKPLLD